MDFLQHLQESCQHQLSQKAQLFSPNLTEAMFDACVAVSNCRVRRCKCPKDPKGIPTISILWVYPIIWAQWMMMVRLQALSKSSNNCLQVLLQVGQTQGIPMFQDVRAVGVPFLPTCHVNVVRVLLRPFLPQLLRAAIQRHTQ